MSHWHLLDAQYPITVWWLGSYVEFSLHLRMHSDSRIITPSREHFVSCLIREPVTKNKVLKLKIITPKIIIFYLLPNTVDATIAIKIKVNFMVFFGLKKWE